MGVFTVLILLDLPLDEDEDDGAGADVHHGARDDVVLREPDADRLAASSIDARRP